MMITSTVAPQAPQNLQPKPPTIKEEYEVQADVYNASKGAVRGLRNVILFIAMSLDGYIADRDGGVGWLNGQGDGGQVPAAKLVV